MNRREVEKLLGGYATGTLTDEEREALFAAALEDQSLFDALAREQPLRDLLAEPAARAHLISVLGEERPPLGVRIAAWLRRPQAIALAAGAAVALVAVALFVPGSSTPVEQKAAVQVATAKRPEPSLPPREEPRPVLRQLAPQRAKEASPKRVEKPAPPPVRPMADLAAQAPAPALPPPPVAETVVADAAPPALPAGAPPPPPLKREIAYTAQSPLARMNAVQREEKAEATRASMPGTGIVAGAVARRQPALAAGMLRYSAL
ncbi:MAG TPA: hypothetical protein VN442_03510, partial [Bryobacteraceae bacterium]|nr:hypothetical protein [Bryobacteraceae bacterium]